MDFRARRGAGQKSTHSWRSSIFVMIMLHASCGDPSSLRSHPISIPIPVISSLCLILRPSLRPFISVRSSVFIYKAYKFRRQENSCSLSVMMMHPILIIIIFIISFRIVQVFTFPNCLANIFSPTSNRLLFKRGPRLMFSKVLPIYLSFPHHLQPHSSYTCAV